MSGGLLNLTNKHKLSNQTLIIIALILVIVGIFSRFIPHPPNFAPIAAIGLFAGVYLPRRFAIILPLIAMIISDIFLGFHGLIFWTWGSFIAIGLFSSYILKKKAEASTILLSSIGASVFFFLVTNFGVWMEGLLYPPTAGGLASSYINALPFFRNTLMGDVFYVVMIFAVYEITVAWASFVRSKSASQQVEA